MGTIMFLLMTIVYWVIACRFLGIYYRRWYEADRKEWSTIHSLQDSQRSAAWTALGLACVWPYYEGGRWIRDSIIHRMTAEERRQQEYETAMRIVTDYRRQKHAEEEAERAAFERKLKEEE
jgi:hypothetical protein